MTDAPSRLAFFHPSAGTGETWARATVERMLNAARLAYGSVVGCALVSVMWKLFQGTQTMSMSLAQSMQNLSWLLAVSLALIGLGHLRIQRECLQHRDGLLPIWPTGLIALLGLVTQPLYALLLTVGWLQIVQARSAFDLLPDADHAAPRSAA